MHAAKHFDPQLGIDIHLYVFPPLPTPIPLPTPHIGIVLDPFDYLPIIGGTIHVNGVKRATAGTGGLDIHIPLGPWMPTLKMPGGPQFEDEIFMGSMTVVADGDPMSRIGMPVLDCNIVGLINPFRLKKPKKPQLSMSLPTAVNLAIPNAVNVGGPPMISIMGMAFRGLFAGLGRLRKTQAFQKAMDKFRDFRRARFAHLPPGLLKCKVLRAEPVDIRRGSVEVTHGDFAIPGRLPFEWTRRYSSSNGHVGACGHGWETPGDIRLEITPEGPVVFQPPDGAFAVFSHLPASAFDAVEPAWSSGARLSRVVGAHGTELQVRTPDDLVYVFKAPPANLKPLRAALSIEIERIEDLCGNHWRFERVEGRLVRIVESGIGELQGRFLSIEQRAGLIHHIALHDPASGENYRLVRYRYDEAAADLIAAHDALDAARTFAYRADHRMLRHTDRTGLSFHYAYGTGEDDTDKVVHAWGDGGLHDYRFAYSRLLQETEVTDSLGHVSIVKFDANDLPLCEIDPLGGVTVFEYDEAGRTTAVVDPMGSRTEFGYDERSNLVQLVRPDESRIATEFDANDKVVAVTDPGGQRWGQTWDARGLLIAQTTPLGACSGYGYNAHGQLESHTNPRGAVTQLAFDRHGLLHSVRDALGHITRFEHDALGRLLKRTDPAGGTTTYAYDAKGRLQRATLPGGASVRCEYDAEDQLTRYADERGAVTKLEYVGIGQIARRAQPDGHSVRYLYDSEEQLTGVVNQRGETYRLVRDALGRIAEEIDYWGQGRRYSYDAGGRITRSVDPLGRVVAFATDKLGRIVAKTLPGVDDPTQPIRETFKYLPTGQLLELRNAASHVLNRFDADGHLIEEVQNGFRIENVYDRVGNRTLRTTSAGNTVEVAFDLLDQPVRIAINDEAPITIERSATGQATIERLSPHLTRTLAYNEQGLLTAQAVQKDGAPLFDTRFEYDQGGNLTRRTDSEHGSDHYTSDPMGRILDHTDPAGKIKSYLNDPAGDRLKTRIREVEMKQAVGGAHEPALWTREGDHEGLHCVFDRAGNLTRRTHDNEPGRPSLHLEWDANQRLARSRWERGERDGQVTTYGYDPLGRRVFKRNPTHTTWFFWDGDALLAEVAAENTAAPAAGNGQVLDFMAKRRQVEALKALLPAAREYIHRPGTFEPLAMVDNRLAAPAPERPPVPTARPEVARSAEGAASGMGPATDAAAATSIQPGSGFGMLGGGTGLGVVAASPAPRDRSEPAPVASPRPILGSTVRLGSPLPDTATSPLPAAGDRPPMAQPPARESAGQQEERVGTKAGLLLYHNDLNGCPTRVTDTDGQQVWSARIATWGGVDRLVRNVVSNPIRLQGQYCDEETGLHYNRHRYFDPATGQFVTADPLGQLAGSNTYGYGWSIFRTIDPLGLMPWPNPTNVGHHLVPQNLARSTGDTDLARYLGTNRNTPTYFFREPYQAGAHEAIHSVQRPHVGRLQGAWGGTADELLEAAGRGLGDVDHIRGDLRIPSTGQILASDVTPSQAFAKLKEWFAQARRGC